MMEPEEFEELVLRDELADKAELFKVLTPIEYGRLRKIRPQVVYRYIRNHKIRQSSCDSCGREKLIPVGEADAAFKLDTEFAKEWNEGLHSSEEAVQEET